MASQLLCFLVKLNKVLFHHLEWWEDGHNLFPSLHPKFNIVYRQLDNGLGGGCRGSCFRDVDVSGGRGKPKLSQDDGNIAGIEPILDSPPGTDLGRQFGIYIYISSIEGTLHFHFLPEK